ncbi:MAG TPA: CBS domain-containing protein [Candidatus Cloacimonadota bacterium]|nr:CBS domain-containing protein [Candidatus Cloacimonadota bacterium]
MIIIISHVNCDLDAFSSMIAAKLLFPEAKLCLSGAPDVGVKQLLKDYPERFDLIKEKNVNLNKIKSVVLVDNSNFDRAGKIGLFLKAKPNIPIICYDHHTPPSNRDDFVYFRHEYYGACATILIKEMIDQGISPDPLTASILALGIYSDTGSFKAINTSPDDFSAMAYLLNNGASIGFIKNYIQPQLNTKNLKIMNQIASSLETYEIRGVIINYLDIELKEEIYNISNLLYYIRQSENMKCMFFFMKLPEKIIIIGRSDYSFIQVNSILKEFGGGGHASSASATVHQTDLESVKKKVYDLTLQSIKEYGTVADIMSKDVETANVRSRIFEVGKKLSNHNFGAIPILKDKKVVGIVTKKDVGQAVLHKLSSKTVDHIMSTDIISITSDTSIYKAQEMLIKHSIGRLLVIDTDSKGNSKLVGILSRRDIIKATFEQQTRLNQDSFDNVKGLLNKINPSVLEVIKVIADFADILQKDAWLVGGFVRDLLMNKESMDIDIVIEGDAIEFSKALSDRLNLPFAGFSQFRTAVIVFNHKRANVIKVDFASARSEIYDKPGILPAVEMSSIKNDLYRRDLTINSIAVQINQKHFGRLFDFYNGRKDIQNKIIKTLNNMSFSDDPTRILRAVRFEQRYQFEIDTKTKHLIMSALDLKLIQNVAVERITQELVKACDDEHVNLFFARLEELSILKSINPNLKMTNEKQKQMKRAERIILWYKESFKKRTILKWLIFTCILCNDMSYRSAEKFFEQYKFPSLAKKTLKEFFEAYEFLSTNLNKKSKGELCLSIRTLRDEILLSIASCYHDEEMFDFIKNYILYDSFINVELNGNYLIENGITDGKTIAKVLKELYVAKINKEINNKEDEINYLKEKYNI